MNSASAPAEGFCILPELFRGRYGGCLLYRFFFRPMQIGAKFIRVSCAGKAVPAGSVAYRETGRPPIFPLKLFSSAGLEIFCFYVFSGEKSAADA